MNNAGNTVIRSGKGSAGKLNIDIRGLKSGLYILKITSKGQSTIQHIAIQ